MLNNLSPRLRFKSISPLGPCLSGRGTELSTGFASISPDTQRSRPKTSPVDLDKSQAFTLHQTYDEYRPNKKSNVCIDLSEHSSLRAHKSLTSTFSKFFQNSCSARALLSNLSTLTITKPFLPLSRFAPWNPRPDLDLFGL